MYKRLKFCTLSLLCISTVYADRTVVVNVDEYPICLPLLFRPPHTAAAGSLRLVIDGTIVSATRHHIIPYSTLSNFFNTVLEVATFASPLGQYLARRVRDIHRQFGEIVDAGAFREDNAPTVYRIRPRPDGNPPPFTFNVDYRMLAAFTWIPGNLFFGPPPDRRSDDPREGFDEAAARLVRYDALATLRRIYERMNLFVSTPSERTMENFDQIMEDLDQVNQSRDSPYDFHAADWVQTDFNINGDRRFALRSHTVVIEELDHELKKREHAIPMNAGYFLASVSDSIEDDNPFDATLHFCSRLIDSMVVNLDPKMEPASFNHSPDVIFPFSISNKQYFYGQDLTNRDWFIHMLQPDGKIGAVTSSDKWGYAYKAQFPFSVGGKQYFYGQNLDGGNCKNWFIQKLSPDGKMGPQTDHGCWDYRYAVQFPFSIGGKQYFYGQNLDGGNCKNWFIQELSPDGKMGPERDHGCWKFRYAVQFPFSIGGKQYIYGHNIDNRYYFIQEIKSDGTMGEETENGFLNDIYPVQFPFLFRGKQYFFAHNAQKKTWFIRQLLEGGQLGPVTQENTFERSFDIVFPFSVDYEPLFFARNEGRWTIGKFRSTN